MSEWQGHKLSCSGQLRNSDSLPPLNRPYPGQAVWLLPHGGCHVEDHHIDLKAIAPKMHWKWCGNRGWCKEKTCRKWQIILWTSTETEFYERRPGHRDIFPQVPSLLPPASPSKKIKQRSWLCFLSALDIKYEAAESCWRLFTDGCSIMKVVLFNSEMNGNGGGEVKSSLITKKSAKTRLVPCHQNHI